MRKPRKGIIVAPLTNERMNDFLQQPLIARLGLIADDGGPYIVPIWYEWDGQHVIMSARAKARYVPYLRTDPSACVSIAEDSLPLRRVLIRGTVEILREAEPDRGEWLERSQAMCRRYLGDAAGDDYQGDTIDRPCIWFRLVPGEVISWDSPEWHSRYIGP